MRNVGGADSAMAGGDSGGEAAEGIMTVLGGVSLWWLVVVVVIGVVGVLLGIGYLLGLNDAEYALRALREDLEQARADLARMGGRDGD